MRTSSSVDPWAVSRSQTPAESEIAMPWGIGVAETVRRARSIASAAVAEVRLGQDPRELLAADARDHLVAAHARAEPVPDLHEDRVAHRVPVGVVEPLEVVEVEDREADRTSVAPRPRHLDRQTLLERAVVRKAGQGVGQRLVGESLTGLVGGDGDGHDLGDPAELALGVVGEASSVAGGGHHDAPDAVVDVDRGGNGRREAQRRRGDAGHRIESRVAVDAPGQVLVADAAQQDRLLERDAVPGDQARVRVVQPDDHALAIGESADQRAVGVEQLRRSRSRPHVHDLLERVAARRTAGDAMQRGVLGHVPVGAKCALGQLMVAGDPFAGVAADNDQVRRTTVPRRHAGQLESRRAAGRRCAATGARSPAPVCRCACARGPPRARRPDPARRRTPAGAARR